jgi:hypothetical protein
MKEEDFRKLITSDELKFDPTSIERLKNKNLERMWGAEKDRQRRDEMVHKIVEYEEKATDTLNWLTSTFALWEAQVTLHFPTEKEK